ncbi:hypothetical protein [Rhizorhapis sp. SPR117]|uniref:hypothetical protein n=1 Tax=Rhizorhapis sp. SPR117 TaxID=2912611 RepID=UPI001F182E29|nr:hypothetical protein [Rhizorhapis sp. SPR117]
MNILNAVGLLVAAIAARQAKPFMQLKTRDWPSLGHIQFLLAVALMISLSLGVYNNFIASNLRESSDSMINSGIALYAVIESAPILLAWLIVVSVWKRGRYPSILTALLLAALFILITVGMNFSRGSRVTVLLIIVLGFQLFHQYVFRLSKLSLFALLIGSAIVFNLMTVYKHLGIQGVSSYLAGEGVPAYLDENYTNPIRIVIGDIGRSDIQASILDAQMEDRIPLAYGRTYVKALTLPLPDFIDPIPDKWSKVFVGSYAQLNIDPTSAILYNNPSGRGSSRIYGMVGESILNFGIFGAVLSFVIFGLLSRWAILYSIHPKGWESALIAPTISALPLFMLFYDLDNIVFRLTMLLGIPGALLLLNRLFQKRDA